jgi:hypothetical protein
MSHAPQPLYFDPRGVLVNLAAQTFTEPPHRKLLFALGFLLASAVGAYKFSQYVINDDISALAYVGLVCLGSVFLVAILNNWRNGVYLFFIWLLFEDLARKFLGNNMAIYFAKDLIVAVVYISFFVGIRNKSVQIQRPPFLVPLLLFIWFGIMQVFNPASTTLVYGVLGVKLFFSYVPLFFVGYALLNSETDLRRFFKINALLVLAISFLGIAQSVVGPSFLNPAKPAEEIRELSMLYRTSPISGLSAYRATSVFVSAGRYCNFLLVSWFLILAFTGYLLLRHRRGRNLAFITLAVLYAAIALSASRGLFMWSSGSAIVIGAAFIWGAPWRQREVIRVFRTVQRAILGIVLGLVVLFFIFPDALLSRLAIYSETLTPYSSSSELQNRTWDYPLRNFMDAFAYPRWPYGYGIGTTSLGVQYVAKIFHEKPSGIGVESGFGALVVELGIGGLLLWFAMSFSILTSAWRVVKNLKGSPWFPIAFVIFWYAFLLFLPITFTTIVIYEDYVVNAYLWLLLGVLFRLPKLALSAQFANVQVSNPHTHFRMH